MKYLVRKENKESAGLHLSLELKLELVSEGAGTENNEGGGSLREF